MASVGPNKFWLPIRKFDDPSGLHKNFRYLEDFMKTLSLGGKEGATIVVATSTTEDTNRADVICDGTNDHTDIQTALNGLTGNDVSLIFLEGTYDIAGDVTFPAGSIGMYGNGVATLNMSGDGTGFTFDGTTEVTIDGFIVTGGASGNRAFNGLEPTVKNIINNVEFTSYTGASAIDINGTSSTEDLTVISNCVFDTITCLGGGSLNSGIIHQDGPANTHGPSMLFVNNKSIGHTYTQAGSVFFRLEDFDPSTGYVTGCDFDESEAALDTFSVLTFAHNFLEDTYEAGDHTNVDHGSLAGLTDDDHTQYLTSARHDTEDHSVALITAVLNDLRDVSAAAPSSTEVLTFTAGSATFDVVDVTRTAFSSDATQHLVNMPATVDSGQLLVMVVVNDGDAVTQTTPTGWEELTVVSPSANHGTGAYYKHANGSEAGTTVDVVTSSAEEAVAHVYRVVAWDSDTPPEIATQTQSNDTTPDSPTLATSWGAGVDTVFIVACLADDFNQDAIDAAPTNYTGNFVTDQSGSATNQQCKLGSSYRKVDTASENPDDWSTLNAVDESTTITIGIKAGTEPGLWEASAAVGTDADAIHDNVSAEISAITAKATPVGGDHILIEDSAASDAKKVSTIAQIEAILDHGSIAGLSDWDHAVTAGRWNLSGGAQIISTGTNTTIVFDTQEDLDNSASDISFSAGVITINTAGWYSITTTVDWDGSTSGRRLTQILAGGAIVGAQEMGPPSTAVDMSQNAAAIVKLAATDTVLTRVFQDSGGNLNVNGTSATNIAIQRLA